MTPTEDGGLILIRNPEVDAGNSDRTENTSQKHFNKYMV